jgi:quercetin dioxygenase-like cupin family protein
MTANRRSENVPAGHAPARSGVRREVLENDAVLVIETIYPREGWAPTHTHGFPHVAYVVDGGTVETRAPDGTTHIMELRPGQTFWRPPQVHSTRNLGPSPVRILEVEVKHAAPDETEKREAIALSPPDIAWIPDPLDPGRKAALLVGDPTADGPYTVRYRAPAGYSIGLHVHPHEHEQITVLSGTIHWSTGEEASKAPRHTVPAGGFALIPAGTPHRLWVTEETILQLTGLGPRMYRYLNPADDPRTRR